MVEDAGESRGVLNASRLQAILAPYSLLTMSTHTKTATKETRGRKRLLPGQHTVKISARISPEAARILQKGVKSLDTTEGKFLSLALVGQSILRGGQK